jgi:hypothetical protein
MQIAKTEISGFWQALLLLLLLVCWNPFSFAQSENRFYSSLQAAAPEEPYIARIGVQIDQIVKIDQKLENFQVVGNLRIEWDEPKLAFEVAEHSRDYKVFTAESFAKYVDEQDIFAPDFLTHNQQGRRFTHDSKVIVFNNGQTIYLERFTATLQAPEFDFIQYPFDTQNFFLRVQAGMPTDFVRFKPLEGYSQLGHQLGEEEWAFNKFWTTTDEVAGITGKPTSRVSFGFNANRHLNYYFLRIFLPLVIIILVSWFTFFLNDYSKRVDMAVANLLVFVAFNFTVSKDLPRLGYITFIDTIMFSTFLFAGLVILLNVMYSRMEAHGRETKARHLDNYTIWVYPFTLVVVIFISWFWYVVEKIHV